MIQDQIHIFRFKYRQKSLTYDLVLKYRDQSRNSFTAETYENGAIPAINFHSESRNWCASSAADTLLPLTMCTSSPWLTLVSDRYANEWRFRMCRCARSGRFVCVNVVCLGNYYSGRSNSMPISLCLRVNVYESFCL